MSGRRLATLAIDSIATLALFGALLAPAPLHAHGDPRDRIAALSARIAASPDDATLRAVRADLRRADDDLAGALDDLDCAAALAPRFPGLSLLRGRVLLAAGDPARARLAFERAVEEAPVTEALVGRARALVLLGEPLAAARDYEAAIAGSEVVKPDHVLERARALEAAGRPGKALDALDEGIAALGPIVSLERPAIALLRSAGRLEEAAARERSLAVAAARAAPTTTAALVAARSSPAALLATVTRGPYLQRGTPSSVVVRWRTDVATDGRVLYGTSAGSLGQSVTSGASATEHELTLSGLTADTRYYYAVGTTSTTLSGGTDHTFVTSPPAGTPKPTRIWVLGDSGTANANARAVRDAYLAFTGSRGTDLWLMLGDNAYDSGTDAEYQAAVFDTYPTTLRQAVLWPTLGNHDTAQSQTPPPTIPYYQVFTLPTAGEAGGLASGTEDYYSFDRGDIHFVCLDSMTSDRSSGGAMLTWLDADLAATTRRWLIAFWHHPPYSKGSHDSDTDPQLTEMRANALPVLEAHGVDLVLAGHSHSYERSFLLDGHYGVSSTLVPSMKKDPGSGREDGTGPYRKPSAGLAPHEGAVYAVAGSSGQTGGGPLNHPAMFISLDQLGSVVVDVDGDRMDVQFVRDTGVVGDHFTLLKAAAPAATGVSPGCAGVTGGRTVTISGSHFASGATVTLAGTVAPVTNVSPTSITVTAPARAAAPAVTGSVVVTNPGGFTSSLANAFTFAVRGDAGNDGRVTFADILYLGAGGPSPSPCNGDANGDGSVGPADAAFLRSYLYAGGAAPPN